MRTIRESDRLSLTECKRILNTNGNHYTDSDILEIRNWLYLMTEISLMVLEEKESQQKNNTEKP